MEYFTIFNSGPASPKVHLEHEKRLRREIANSNERRRMQSINSGFQSLKTLLPHQDGEKLSKVCQFNIFGSCSSYHFYIHIV